MSLKPFKFACAPPVRIPYWKHWVLSLVSSCLWLFTSLPLPHSQLLLVLLPSNCLKVGEKQMLLMLGPFGSSTGTWVKFCLLLSFQSTSAPWLWEQEERGSCWRQNHSELWIPPMKPFPSSKMRRDFNATVNSN